MNHAGGLAPNSVGFCFFPGLAAALFCCLFGDVDGWLIFFVMFLGLSAFLARLLWDCTFVGANKIQKMMSWKVPSLNRCVWGGGGEIR